MSTYPVPKFTPSNYLPRGEKLEESSPSKIEETWIK